MTPVMMYDWARIACLLFGKGDARYKLNTVYLEFANVASPGDTVSAPEFSAADGREYYEGLSGDRDYLRVALPEPTVGVASGYEAYFAAGAGNQLTFTAQSFDAAGENGLDFSAAQNSLVYGLALVASPDRNDRTKDLIFARGYYEADDQVPKEAGRPLVLFWTQDFSRAF